MKHDPLYDQKIKAKARLAASLVEFKSIMTEYIDEEINPDVELTPEMIAHLLVSWYEMMKEDE